MACSCQLCTWYTQMWVAANVAHDSSWRGGWGCHHLQAGHAEAAMRQSRGSWFSCVTLCAAVLQAKSVASSLPALPTAAGLAPLSSAAGAVVPNISSALAWLRSCAGSRQQLRMQVSPVQCCTVLDAARQPYNAHDCNTFFEAALISCQVSICGVAGTGDRVTVPCRRHATAARACACVRSRPIWDVYPEAAFNFGAF